MNNSTNYYKVIVSYEIPYNILDSQEPSIIQGREILYDSLKNIMTEEKYEKFSINLTMYQLRDTQNYLVTFEAFFRSTSGLPIEEFVGARDIKDKVRKELESFFNSVDCEYKQLSIKTLV